VDSDRCDGELYIRVYQSNSAGLAIMLPNPAANGLDDVPAFYDFRLERYGGVTYSLAEYPAYLFKVGNDDHHPAFRGFEGDVPRDEYAQRWGGVHFEVLTPEEFIQQYEAAHPTEMQALRDEEALERQQVADTWALQLLAMQGPPVEPTTPWLDLVPGELHSQPHFMHATYNGDRYLVFWPMLCRFFLAYRPSTDTVWEILRAGGWSSRRTMTTCTSSAPQAHTGTPSGG